jgi:hypothetical protein
MIRINLLAEEQAAEEMRRRDPVKRAIYVAGAVVMVMIFWVLSLQAKLVQSNRTVQAAESEWKKLEPEDKLIKTNLNLTGEIERKLVNLQRLSTNRFLWTAPLNALQFSLVPKLRVTEVVGKQNYTTTPAKVDPNTKKEEKPATVTEKLLLTVKGDDFAPDSDGNHTKFMEAISKGPFFRDQLRRPDPFKSVERVRSPASAGENQRTATFSFDCQFPERVR